MGIILDSIDFKEGYKVLDAGCGNGSLLIELEKIIGNKCKLVGIDLSRKKIEIAKKNSKNYNINFEAGDFKKIPYENNYFDIIISTFAFYYMNTESKNKALQELKRVLKPGGKLMIIDLGKPIGIYSKFVYLFLKYYKNVNSNIHGELLELIEKKDFKIIFVKNTIKLFGTINIILTEK